ncbi:cilia- and flagella-associated protein 70-like isoform X2 [Anneissia japonica]|uniref:cilia- and flagella-associated protein 70-like isoform X2 n=1 Tax=Anneissia japonica TaxID=1529436 RepID=UPI001425836E|nr:cilia- and flagella-associated protein 70-like isoform X2 [Anneissia japonica]
MTEEEHSKHRPPEPINITVLRARHLRGSKGDALTSLVRVEYGTSALGESSKVDSSADVAAEYNFNSKIDCSFEDPVILDEIAYKPILITVVEVLPKEKKQKEERTNQLGQCTVDLLPLVKGENKYKSTLVIHPLPGSPFENLAPDSPRPELDVVVYVNEPLLTNEQLLESNLMTVTVEAAYSVPESWNPSGTQFLYNVTLPMPITNDRESTVVLSNGVLKSASDKDQPSKQKKWTAPGAAQGNAIYIHDQFVQSSNYDQEDGELTGKEDREFRIEVETEKNRVIWNTERRCYMEKSAIQSLQSKIAQTRVWPVEIMRTTMPTATKAKGKEEENPIFFHGVAYVNLAPLLYPGVKKIRGAFRIHAFNEQELCEKTKRKSGLAEEAVRLATAMHRNASPFVKAPSKSGKDDKAGKEKEKDKDAAKKQPSSLLKTAPAPSSDIVPEAEVPAQQNIEGQQYDEARSYIFLEFVLKKPIVPKREPEELAKKVSEYIPPRPLFPRRTNGAQRAVDDFHQQVASIGNLVLEEFRELFADQLANGELPQVNNSVEERRRKLIYELNSSGKYFAFKEQLKHSVVKVVREKYLQTSTFTDQERLQAFLSELYVFLVDEMHVGLSNVLSLEDETPVPAPLTDTMQLKHFAREAEVNENFELAAKYYQERLAQNRNDADNWFDYGTFCLLINDISKAEECFKETISIQQQHLSGLLLYGVVCAMEERNDMAETFFEAATAAYPDSVLAWTMLGLFYDGIDNDIQAEFAFLEAQKLNLAHAVAKQKQQQIANEQADASVTKPVPPSVISVAPPEGTGDASLLHGAENQQDTGLLPAAPELTKTPATTEGKNLSPSAYKVRQAGSSNKKRISVSKSAASIQDVQRSKSQCSASKAGSKPGTPDVDEPAREPTPTPEFSIYILAAEFLLEVKATQFCERALAHELLAPKGGPSGTYYVALSRLKLQKKELEEADESLKEALIVNNQDPDAWSIQGHLSYLQGNMTEARNCYERTLSFIADAREMHAIYLRLASIYLQEGKFEEAKNTFLLACKKSPSCVSWLGVGIACYRLGELSEAEDALSEANILNNSDPLVWGYLSLVCLHTGRQLEAEQSYKYAIKVNLQDEELLAEIHSVQEQVGFGNPQF